MVSSGADYLKGLNERQKEAVLHASGPLLIVAGAGAGKTKTITHRIAHLIEGGVRGPSILAVTFTNKAAGEMRERVERLLSLNRGGAPLICTFHSLGVRLLREFGDRAGIPRGFSIWDRDDSARSIKKTLEKLGIEQWKPTAILSAISIKKGDGVSMQEFETQARTFRERTVAQAWRMYEASLADEDALDFDDLLLRTLSLLQKSPETLALLQNRWQYITIDEYQDTNKSQYEIARLLAGERKNICVVGDTDQNIYSWRGADIEHLLSFEKTFPGAKVVLLEENYRSTRTILAAANSVIEKNVKRKAKHLFTENPTGEPLSFYSAQNEMDEAWFVATTAQQLIEHGMQASEIAVLYRENFQSRAIEEALLGFSLPYRVVGTRFFERKEVKDTLSYLRLALNPKSKIDLSRIVGVPPRGIGAATLARMLANEDELLPSGVRAKVIAFRQLLLHIKHALETLPASEAVRYVVETSGMEKMFKGDSEEGHERLENISELINLATRYDFATPPEGIEQLLEEAALVSDQDELDRAAKTAGGSSPDPSQGERFGGAMSLMTAHASKGLEFDAVFITGLEQGLFPSMRENDTAGGKDPEEERRLFYVAVTRARKRVFLSFANERMKYGSREHTLPSEFLEDIDERLLAYASPEMAVSEGIIQ